MKALFIITLICSLPLLTDAQSLKSQDIIWPEDMTFTAFPSNNLKVELAPGKLQRMGVVCVTGVDPELLEGLKVTNYGYPKVLIPVQVEISYRDSTVHIDRTTERSNARFTYFDIHRVWSVTDVCENESTGRGEWEYSQLLHIHMMHKKSK